MSEKKRRLAGSFALAVLIANVAPAHADVARFDILEYAVEGNTLLSVQAIEAAVYPHLGEDKTIAAVEAARLALEQAYHDSGYLTVFVNIPEQKVDGGVVRLQVVQGEVERLRVTGSRYYSLGRIKAAVPALAEGNVPYFPDVQKQLAGLARVPDRAITPVLRAGREPGKVEVDLKVTDRLPVHGSVELNNRYSADTTHTRLSGSVRWDNLWQREHSIGAFFQTAPENPDDSRAISATYSIPLASGNYLAAYAVRTDSDVASLGTLGVIGVGTIGGLRYILPLRSRPGLTHSLTLGVDYKDFGQTVQLQGADSFNSPISYLPFMASWDATVANGGDTTRYNVAANFHLRDVVGDSQEFADKRFNASAAYFYVRGAVDQTWRWDSGMGLKAGLGFQLAGDPLISNEQFALGGADSVRGYLESEVLGDRGLNLTLEWQSPHLHKPWKSALETLHAVVFVDGGHVEISDPLPDQKRSYTLAGAGFGLRAGADRGLKAAVDFAWPLRDGARTRARDERFHASLSYSF